MLGSCSLRGQLSMDKDCPRTVSKLATYFLFGGQFIKFVDNYKNRWTIMKFRGQSLSMDNCSRKQQDPKVIR
jgi:hypothetical protein